MIPKCEECGSTWMTVETDGIFEGYWKCLKCGYVGEKSKLACPECDRPFAAVRAKDGSYVAWCPECEHTYKATIEDCGSDPLMDRFLELVE